MAKEPFAAKLTSIWIGGFIFWVIKGFKGKIEEQYKEEFENSNLWLGYIVTLLFVIFAIYFLVEK